MNWELYLYYITLGCLEGSSVHAIQVFKRMQALREVMKDDFLVICLILKETSINKNYNEVYIFQNEMLLNYIYFI